VEQPLLADVAEHLEDGSNATFLCELHVLGTSMADWQRVLDVVTDRTDWSVEYSEDGRAKDIPEQAELIFERRQKVSALLRIVPEALSIHAHFFCTDAVEFDVSARHVNTQSRLDELLGFARIVGRAVNRQVLVTGERGPVRPFLIYDPGPDDWARH